MQKIRKFLSNRLFFLPIVLMLLSIIFVPMNESLAAESSEGVMLDVVSHSSYLNHEKWKELFSGKTYEGNFFHVIGEVMNVGIESVTYSVEVSFFDAKGNMINITKPDKSGM